MEKSQGPLPLSSSLYVAVSHLSRFNCFSSESPTPGYQDILYNVPLLSPFHYFFFKGTTAMNWIQRKIYLYNVTFGLYMLDWWERYLFNILIVVLMWFILYNSSKYVTDFCKRWFENVSNCSLWNARFETDVGPDNPIACLFPNSINQEITKRIRYQHENSILLAQMKHEGYANYIS